MDLLEIIHENKFPLSLFPNGLVEPILIGQISLSLDNKISIKVHTRQKPSQSVKKWGEWEKDYNVIVLELSGVAGGNLSVKNWKGIDFSKLSIDVKDDLITLKQDGNNWELLIETRGLIFQGCSTYFIDDSE